MNGKQLIKLGYPPGPAIGVALRLIPEAARVLNGHALKRELKAVLEDPIGNAAHPQFAELATALRAQAEKPVWKERESPAPYRIWGAGLEAQAVDQLTQAVRLPVAVRGALMPDAHVGYGLPIGGVLATENAVIPYAVGVDIACRMRLSVFDVPADQLKRLHDQLVKILQRETMFGTGAQWKKPLEHEVLDADWSVTPVTQRVFEKARDQLGTSGSGNHFVEFGILTVGERPAETSDSKSEISDLNDERNPKSEIRNPKSPSDSQSPGDLKSRSNPQSGIPQPFSLPPGQYLALLSHSGSRGAGATVADFYSRLAMEQHPELPPELRRLAWLDLASEAGQEYWAAMNLMGDYAAANHALIHRKIARALGADVLAGVENHHNFAWKEQHEGRELIVHRKGATPAAPDVLGVIPGSMASPAFVVRGKGGADSLDSASHGAGRVMSRTAAREKFRWNHIKPMLEERGVHLLSAGIDENPFVYKNIHEVMAAQGDLVDAIARFDPKIVKMADAGEKPED